MSVDVQLVSVVIRQSEVEEQRVVQTGGQEEQSEVHVLGLTEI